MSVFQARDYREAISTEIKERRARGENLTYLKVSAKTDIQNSYFSNVLNGRAHFNADQIYSIGQVIGLDDEEIQFVTLLMEWERSAQPSRKKNLKEQIDKIQAEHLKAEKRTRSKVVNLEEGDLAAYYLNPYMRVAHVLLGLDEQVGHEKLAQILGTTKDHVGRIISSLEKMGYLEVNDKGVVKLLKTNLHLSKTSYFHDPHLSLMRLRSVDHMQKLNSDEKQAVTITFSADDQVFKNIQEEFLKFLSRCEGLVRDAPAKKAYQLQFDLFPWQL